uniref:Uncharacterized protein n=1 Tax=Arundo donax TaxID=35708 RepID=A0A0A9GB38_ARUDO
MNGGHQTLNNAKLVIDDLQQNKQSVKMLGSRWVVTMVLKTDENRSETAVFEITKPIRFYIQTVYRS